MILWVCKADCSFALLIKHCSGFQRFYSSWVGTTQERHHLPTIFCGNQEASTPATAFGLEPTQPGLDAPSEDWKRPPWKDLCPGVMNRGRAGPGKRKETQRNSISSLVDPHSFNGRFGKRPPGALLAWGPSK